LIYKGNNFTAENERARSYAETLSAKPLVPLVLCGEKSQILNFKLGHYFITTSLIVFSPNASLTR
jgi:hypothetical protein